MSKLNLISDLAALARAGMKSDDIKEIIASLKDEPEKKVEEPAEILPKEEVQQEQVKTSGEEPEEGVDYKKMYEDSQKEIFTVKESLKQAQALNTSKQLPEKDDKSLEQQLMESYKDIIS